MKCDQCAWVRINGVFCHESGCPNEKKIWDGEEWVRDEWEAYDDDNPIAYEEAALTKDDE